MEVADIPPGRSPSSLPGSTPPHGMIPSRTEDLAVRHEELEWDRMEAMRMGEFDCGLQWIRDFAERSI